MNKTELKCLVVVASIVIATSSAGCRASSPKLSDEPLSLTDLIASTPPAPPTPPPGLEVPSAFLVYTDPGKNFSFNYPANWSKVLENDPVWLPIAEGADGTVLFQDKTQSSVVGVQYIDVTKISPGMVLDDKKLLEITDRYIESAVTADNASHTTLLSKNQIAVDPLADAGNRTAYELKIRGNDEPESMLVITLTYSKNNVYRLVLFTSNAYYSAMLPAYDQMLASVRFR